MNKGKAISVTGRGDRVIEALTFSRQITVRSALRAGRPLPPGTFLILISVRDCRGVKLTTHLELVPRSRKRGSLHPLLHTPSWRS
jgi:hypothetical protein